MVNEDAEDNKDVVDTWMRRDEKEGVEGSM